MNLATGQSSKKEHLENGSLTACNRRSSGPGKNSYDQFKFLAKKYPNECCQKCLKRFNEKQNRIKK